MGHTPLTSKISGQFRFLNLEVPELKTSIREVPKSEKTQTYDPASVHAVAVFLCVSPLVEEIICRSELGRKTPFYRQTV